MAVKSFDKSNSSNRQIDILKDFSGGLNTELADSATKDNQFRKLTNFDIDKAGSLMKRPGLYKIPYVEKLLNRRLDDVINDQEITIDGKPVDKTQFEIQDCIPFFDGVHWVYNYITTFGVFVILLDKNMNIPNDLGKLDLTTNDYKIIAQFYPLDLASLDSSKNAKITFKISKYNDQYLMYKTLYQNNFSLPNVNGNKRQVEVYSWNPIYNDYYPGFNLAKETLYPQWLEATYSKRKIITDTSFGEVKTLKGSSNKLFDNDNINTSTLVIHSKHMTTNYDDPNNFILKKDFKVIYRPNTPSAQLVVKMKSSNVYNYDNYIIDLKHQNGDPITDEQISNIFLYDSATIQVNLINNVRYDNKANELFAANFLDDERKDPNNNIETFNNFLKTTIKWFWIRLDMLDYGVGNAIVYSYSTSQILTRSLFPNSFSQNKLNVWHRADGNDSYHWLDHSWGDFKSKLNARDFKAKIEDFDNDYTKSRANRIYWTKMGAPYKYTYEYKPIAKLRQKPFYFIPHIDRSSKVGLTESRKLPGNDPKYSGDLGWLNRYGFNNISDIPTFKNEMSLNVNKYHGLDFVREWKEYDMSDSNGDNIRKISDLVAFEFPTAMVVNEKTEAISYPTAPSQYIYYTYLRDPLVRIYTLPTIDNRYSIAQSHGFTSVRQMFLNFHKYELTKYAYTHNNKVFFAGGENFKSMIAAKHYIDEEYEYFGFGNADVSIYMTNNKQFRVSAATMNKNTFNYIHPTNDTFLDDIILNNLPRFVHAANIKYLSPLQLFGEELLNTFSKAVEHYNENSLINPKLFLEYLDDNATKQYLNLDIKEFDLMNTIISESADNPNDNLFKFELLLFRNHITNKISPLVFKVSFRSKRSNKTINILNIDDINQLISNINNWDQFIRSLRLFFSSKWLVSANSENQVINFKQQVYTKPTLNDIVNIWYNLVLFSKFQVKDNVDNANPNIYDPSIHPYISSTLMEYPDSSLNLQYSSIQLFGLHPVNDLITTVGKQRFQLFYKMNKGFTYDNFKVALTTMSIADYNAMINSGDFSTDILPNDTSKKKSPNWTEWGNVFSIRSSKPNIALFELEVPSTTSPYLILIQIAEKSGDTTKGQIKLSTLVETRLEIQPSNSTNTKLNISSIFDEFVLSNKLVSYSSNLIAYGNSNKIFFNEISNPTYFPLSRIVELKTPEAIKSANVFQNKLILSTENSKFYIGGSSFDSSSDPFYLREISSDSGILAPKSDVPMGNYLYFLDTTGIKILKNLFGTADKEFAFESIDTIIKSIVAKDRDACAATIDNKYYICFPNYRYMLVYHFDYKAWVSYESQFFNFSTMFVNDGELYGVDRTNFKIFKFDKNVYVDNWNEVEEWYELYKGTVTKFGGYVKTHTIDKQEVVVQQGAPITCELETKQLDQDYSPHRKKYDYILISSSIDHKDKQQKNFGASLSPIVKVDNNLVNYKFNIVKDNNVYNYIEDNNSISIRENSALNATTTLNKNRLGLNNLNNYYYIPVQRKGNTLSIGFKFEAPTNINIDSLYIRYGLTKIKKSRGGIS